MAATHHTTFPQLEMFAAYSPITPLREVWLPVVGWEDLYEVSNRGRVRSRDRTLLYTRIRKGIVQQCTVVRKGRMLVCHGQKNSGYLAVNLSREHEMHRKVVHRLVIQAFVGPGEDGNQVNHINGDKCDNRLENLEWVTPKRNTHHAMELGLRWNYGERHVRAKHTAKEVLAIRRLYAEGLGISVIARQTQTHVCSVHNIVHRRTWKHLPEE